MIQAHDELRRVIKKYVVSLTLAPLLVVGSAWAGEPALRLLNSVEIPVSAMNPLAGQPGAGTYSFDISFVDQSDGTYYLADRFNFAVDALFAESISKQIFPLSRCSS